MGRLPDTRAALPDRGRRSLPFLPPLPPRMLPVLSIPVFFLFSPATAAVTAPAQEPWVAPEEARAVENPIPPSEEALAAGRAAYEARCATCHGDTARGDGKATRFIRPAPADLATVEARDRMTDGEIFYKITEGRKPMPGMARTLSEEERWQVVHYLRTLQPPPD